jgi:YHS domain-containing protein
MVKDPICGMMVDEKKAKFKSDYNGKTFYFCAASCKATFDKAPTKYAGNVGTTGHSCNCGHDHC